MSHPSLSPSPQTPSERLLLVIAALAAAAAVAAAALRDSPAGDGFVLAAPALAVVCLAACLVARASRHEAAARESRTRIAERELAATARTVAVGGDLGDILGAVAHAAARAVGADAAAVVRLLPGDTCEVVGTAGARGMVPARGGHVSSAGSGIVARVHASGGPVVVGDGAAPGGEADGGVGRSAVGVPVVVDGTAWGVLYCLALAGGRFRSGDGAALARHADLAAIAVRSATERARWQAMATTDPLTGLPNGRAFRERLDAESDRARRHGAPLAVVVMDVDRLPDLTHRAGRQAGDRVMRDLARALAGRARTSDMVARFSDREFAWLMPECDAWDAWKAADAFRTAVTALRLGGLPGQTLSAGICDLAEADHRPDRLLDNACGALYWAHEHGRDLCVRYSADVVVETSEDEQAAQRERARALEAIRLLAQSVDARSLDRHGHSERVAAVAAVVAAEMGWDEASMAALREAGLVHDVGAVGLPESLLSSPLPLAPADMERVRSHCALGAQMVSDVLSADQVAWVRGHHERWDGGGYPDGLGGEAIPVGARLLAAAEAVVAMTSDRPHRGARTLLQAREELLACRGTQFAPDVADVLAGLITSGRIAEVLSAAPHQG